jgi:hypothetical protein
VAILVVAVCLAAVIGFQATREVNAAGNPRVFVPSPRFFEKLAPSFRTTIADAYWLGAVQYYGEHVDGDRRLDSLPAMLDLVTTLSPHFIEPYLFSTFALVDAGEPQMAYDLLRRGFKANRRDWRLPFQLGFMAYTYGPKETKATAAAQWFAIAGKLPGSPAFVPRLAANLLAKGGEREKAALMWGQIYAQGDKYVRAKAVAGLEATLPAEEQARIKALAPLYRTMPRKDFDALVEALVAGSTQ